MTVSFVTVACGAYHLRWGHRCLMPAGHTPPHRCAGCAIAFTQQTAIAQQPPSPQGAAT